MRILHIIGDSEFGGGSQILKQLCIHQRGTGHDVSVLTTNPKLIEVLTKHHISVVPLNVIWRPIRPCRDLVGALKLRRFLLHNQYDLIHTHTSKAGLIGRWAAMAARTPHIIHTVHGFAFHEKSSFLKRLFYTCIEKCAAGWCDAIVTVSEFHKEWALSLGIADRQKVHAIANGVVDNTGQNFSREIPVLPAELLNAGHGCITFLVPSRLAVEKGLDDLVDAVFLLQQSQPNLKFHVFIAGDGPLSSTLRRTVIKQKLSDKITFLGFRSDLPRLLFGCDCVVLPSIREGLSLSLLEAMSFGKAIVATEIGGNMEALGLPKCGLVVPACNAGALAKAMYEIATNKLHADELGMLARETFCKRYKLQTMLLRYDALYNHITSQHQRRRVAAAA